MSITYASSTITITGGKDTGTATSGAATTLTDTSKSWTTNAYAGYQVWIHTGTGAGAIADIVSNTGTVITVRGGFYKIDHANRAVTTVTPDNTSQYIILFKAADIKAANDSGSWGVFTLQGTHQYNCAAKIVIGDGSTKSGLGTAQEDISFPSTITYVELTVKGAGYYLSGRYADMADGSSLSNYNTRDVSAESSSMISVESGGYMTLLADSKIICKNGAQPMTFLSGSYPAILGGNGGQVVIESLTLRNNSANFFCDGLLLNGEKAGIVELSTFAPLVVCPTITRFVTRKRTLALAGSNAVSAPNPPVKLVEPTFKDNTYDWRPWGGHNFILVNPTWNANIQWLAHATLNATGWLHEKYTFDITVVSSNVGVDTVGIFIKDVFGTAVLNTDTNSSGVLTQQEILYVEYKKTVANSTAHTDTYYSPHNLRVRKYGYKFSSEPITFNSPVKTRKSVDVNTAVVASYATAWSYTGAAIVGSTNTTTLSGARTMQELYDYTQA